MSTEEDAQNWHRLHDRYWATAPVDGETGQEQFAINKAIYWGLCECAGRALCACRIVQVVTTVVPRDPDQYGHPRSSIYVTVIAEPMIPPSRGNKRKSDERTNL